jgi:diaminohydroxyphosphoribosylaminopyrimidine deaminase / 5-amino-6-(5-phosphoribosylamino)uracil reductase
VHGAFLDAGLADSVAVFLAPRILGDPGALPFAQGKRKAKIASATDLARVRVKRLGPDILVLGDLKR